MKSAEGELRGFIINNIDMKREIKFRGKKVDTGEWVYGCLIQRIDCTEIHDGVFTWAIKPETVGQFTGLLDKNGVEIYEGDIVEFTRAQCRGVSRGTQMFVSYQTYCFCGFGFDETMALTKRRAKECFVVGNIYDNPELLTINNKNSMNTEKSNINMDKVYEFWYNECIYESAAQCMSLHRTREGAEKAMERHKKEVADKWGQEGVENFVDMAWGIEERIIEE